MGYHPAMIEHHGAVGDALGFVEFVGGEHYAAPSLGQIPHDAADEYPAVHVHTRGGFIEERDIGTCGERKRKRQTLSLTTAHPAPRGSGAIGEADALEQETRLLTVAVQRTEQPNHIERTRRRVHASVLEHHAHPTGEHSLRRGWIEAEHAHVATRSPTKPLAHLDGRGLTRTVGAEDRSDRAGTRRERDSVHGHEIPVLHPEVLHFQRQIGHGMDARGAQCRPVGSSTVIDVRLLRSDLDSVRARMGRRNKPELLTQIDEAVALDAQLRELASERDDIRRRVNEISKQVGQLRRDGQGAQADEAMAESRRLGDTEKDLASRTADTEERLRQVLLRIPNIISDEAPTGTSDEDNPVVRVHGFDPASFGDHQRVPHWETGVALGILDNERAAKISGAMFSMLRGAGATMSRALCQLALDRNADAFEEIRPPTLVTSATLTSTGQLPKFADDAYAIERDDLWCIPTAEVPLTSISAGEILDEAELPKRFMAYSPCYRRESGSAGRDTRGLLRGHEFDKVEILAYAAPEHGRAMLDEFVARAAGTIEALGLPYRVISICSGDLGQSHHLSFDIEVFAPGSDRWLEVSSVSWFSDYQARRADIRFRRAGQKGTEHVHTLNGSALAVPRVLAAILENYRQPDGSVVVPQVLRPYMRGITVIGPK